MFHVALFEPQIAPNTGNIIRLCANNGFLLHLIEPMGFDLEQKKLRRAGLDYHDMAIVKQYQNFQHFCSVMKGKRIIACTTKAERSYDSIAYEPEDILLFGAETHGLSEAIQQMIPQRLKVRIPMQSGSRSINLSNAVAIISYEAWRQHGFSDKISGNRD